MTAILTVAVASRALFDLEEEHALFEREGLGAYAALQAERERLGAPPGPAYAFIDALSRINANGNPLAPDINLVVVSRNDAVSGLRVLESISHHGVGASRAMMTGGRDVARLLSSIGADFFLTRSPADAEAAMRMGIGSAVMEGSSLDFPHGNEIRVAFDGDAVLFDDVAERAFETGGYQGWIDHETTNRDAFMGHGPAARLAKKLSDLKSVASARGTPIRIALVTARDHGARARAVKTLRHWGVSLDEAYFVGAMSKADVLADFKPHLFLDDRASHVMKAAPFAPSGLVPRVPLPEAADEPETPSFPSP